MIARHALDLPLAMTLIVLAGSVSRAEEPPPDAGGVAPTRPPCRGVRVDEVWLEAFEFRFEGYDARRGRAALATPVELSPTTHRAQRVRFRWPTENGLVLPMPAATFEDVVEAQRGGTLRMRVAIEPANAMAAPDEDDCGAELLDAVPIGVGLQVDHVRVAERDLRQPLDQLRRRGNVELGEVSADGLEPVSCDALREPALDVGERCLRELEGIGPSVRGALTVQIERTAAGERLHPSVAVDGLVSQALERCVLRGLFDEPRIWTALTPGARGFVPFYFRDGAGGVDPAESGTNAP